MATKPMIQVRIERPVAKMVRRAAKQSKRSFQAQVNFTLAGALVIPSQ